MFFECLLGYCETYYYNMLTFISDIYRLCLTKEEGIIPKNKGDEGRKKFFVVVGKDQEGNAIGFVLINSEINKHLPESRRKLHNKPSLDCKILENQNFIQI